jgi:hypothetical protein
LLKYSRSIVDSLLDCLSSFPWDDFLFVIEGKIDTKADGERLGSTDGIEEDADEGPVGFLLIIIDGKLEILSDGNVVRISFDFEDNNPLGMKDEVSDDSIAVGSSLGSVEGSDEPDGATKSLYGLIDGTGD